MDSLIEATVKEFDEFSRRVHGRAQDFLYSEEWNVAIKCGWDDHVFNEIFVAYIKSTQHKLLSTEDATLIKGRPLEKIAKYFLKCGGVVHDIEEISAPRRWQVDGQGLLVESIIRSYFGGDLADRIGFQLYLECKNHTEPLTNDEFAQHCQRMVDHCCNFGVIVSTSGYSINAGTGISDKIYFNSGANKFHVLFTVDVFGKIIADNKPPLFLVKEAFGFAINERYRHDRALQTRYSKANCHLVAESEFNSYCSTTK